MVKVTPGKEKYYVERSERDLKKAIKNENTTEYLRDNGIDTKPYKLIQGGAILVAAIAVGLAIATAGAAAPLAVAAVAAAIGTGAHYADKHDKEKVDKTIAKHADLTGRVESQETAQKKHDALKYGTESPELASRKKTNKNAVLARKNSFDEVVDTTYVSPDISKGANLAEQVSASR